MNGTCTYHNYVCFRFNFWLTFSRILGLIYSAHNRTVVNNITKEIGKQLFTERQIRGMHIFIVLIVISVVSVCIILLLKQFCRRHPDITENSTRGFQGPVKCSAGKGSHSISPAEGKYCSCI